MKRIMTGESWNMYVIIVSDIKLSKVIPRTVRSALDAREAIVNRKSFLFFVTNLTNKGINTNNIA
jgi:hypothetical protein